MNRVEALMKYHNILAANIQGEISDEEMRTAVDALNSARDQLRFFQGEDDE